MVPGECLTQYLMSAGRVFIQLPSVCGMCFPLVLTGWVLWLISLKILKWTVAAAAQGGGIWALHVVETQSFLHVWCGYQCSPNPAADSIPQPFWKSWKTWGHIMPPPWAGIGHLLGSSCPLECPAQCWQECPAWLCLSAAPWEQDLLLYSFIHHTEWKQKSDRNTESINHY